MGAMYASNSSDFDSCCSLGPRGLLEQAQAGRSSATDTTAARRAPCRLGVGGGRRGGCRCTRSSRRHPAKRILYFDFDSSEIKAKDPVVAAHARYLAATATVRVRLEGHTDERGSREYNIGLGERRAQAVRRALLLQGAPKRSSPP